ncbi:MAG: hypothetical protein IT327_32420 [Anaerolineae bacterium]|nr:hypothetical protein [Anaerolineae bacterium]
MYQFHHHGRAVQVKKPAQQTTPTIVATSVTTAVADAASIICDLRSHGNMRAFFSQTDNVDERGARLYAVIGRLDSKPEIWQRVGVYGYWLALPLRLQGYSEVVFLGLQPPLTGPTVFTGDTIFVRTVSISLTYKVNLGDYNSIKPGYTIGPTSGMWPTAMASCIWRWTACRKACGPTWKTRFPVPREKGAPVISLGCHRL